MRMWCVDPVLLCDRHLLGEHVELHMLVGYLKRNKPLGKFITLGLVDPDRAHARHESLVAEMLRRGFRHQSPLEPLPPSNMETSVNMESNLAELARRCAGCRARIEAARASFA